MPAEANAVQQGDRFRCPTCGCEIMITNAPDTAGDQSFVDCCGHQMERAVTGGG